MKGQSVQEKKLSFLGSLYCYSSRGLHYVSLSDIFQSMVESGDASLSPSQLLCQGSGPVKDCVHWNHHNRNRCSSFCNLKKKHRRFQQESYMLNQTFIYE